VRLLAISLGTAMAAAGLAQQQPAEPLTLHDPPHYKKGQIETAAEAGVHSSAASRFDAPMPPLQASKKVEAKLRRGLATYPENPEANLALGTFLLEAGRAGEAVPLLGAAVRLAPGSIQARHDLAVALLEERRLTEAEALLRELQVTGGSEAVVTHLEARWLAASGKPAEAAEKFQRSAERAPTEAHLFDWGNHMLSNGAAEPASRIFTWATQKYPQSVRLKIAEGMSYYARGDYDRAVEVVCAAIRLDPEDPRPLASLGRMIGVAPQRERQIKTELERFARVYPEHAEAQYFFGLSLATLGESDIAERQFRRAAALDPEMAQPHIELGKLLGEKSRSEEAIRELEGAVRLAPNISGAHYRLAQLYQRAGNKILAQRHFVAYRKLRADEAAREARDRSRRSGLTVSK
jgi:Flp pilus assembly protein TadD